VTGHETSGVARKHGDISVVGLCSVPHNLLCCRSRLVRKGSALDVVSELKAGKIRGHTVNGDITHGINPVFFILCFSVVFA